MVAVAGVNDKRDIALAIVLCSPWVLCCLVVLWLIRSNPPKKSGLALAVGVGLILSLLSILPLLTFLQDLLLPPTFRRELVLMAYAVSFAVTSVGVLVSAIKTYNSLKREAGGSRRLAWGFAIPVIILVLIAIVLSQFLGREPPMNESSAAASLRTVAMANVTYSETYKQGFAGTLAQLGPPSEACPAVSSACADLLDIILSGINPATATPVKSGYRFTYVALNPAPSPDQPNATYSLTATPVSPGKSGTSTFCVDQTNVLLKDASGRMRTGTTTGCGWPIGETIGPL